MNPLSAEPQVRSANIFINYRREDSAGHAGRLFDGLSSHFPGRLFMDVDTIAPGIDFVEAIEQAVGACEVLIVVIGREWLTLKNATGGRRIDDNADFVRLELETALARNIRIIPVLVQDAQPPRPEDLPPSLARLARRNAIELSDVRWGYDVERLAQTIQGVLRETTSTPPEKLRQPPATVPAGPRAWPRAVVFPLAALLLVSAGWISKNRFQSAATDILVNPTAVQAQPGPVPVPAQARPVLVPAQPDPAPVEPVPSPRPSPEKPDVDIKPVEPNPAPIHAGPAPVRIAPAPAPAQPSPAPVPAPLPKPADIKPVEPKPSPAETLQLPEVTITSPKNGDTACNRVTVSGVISGLGSGQHAFLCFRTQGVVYPRGELHPSADGRWSMTTDRAHHDFDILVVITTSLEAVEALNAPWSVPPKEAHIAPTSVSMRAPSKVMGFLKSKCGKNGS
jgi:hypothetical protein